MALISKLENIADAIREKTGKEDKLTLDEMAEHTHTRGTMNITGYFYAGQGDDGGYTYFSTNGRVSGALYYYSPVSDKKVATETNANFKGAGLGFDASRNWTGSTSTGNYSKALAETDTVQPNAVKKLLYICVGNTVSYEGITEVVNQGMDILAQVNEGIAQINEEISTRADGQWVIKDITLSTATAITSSTVYLDLSEILPNDGYSYMVTGYWRNSRNDTSGTDTSAALYNNNEHILVLNTDGNNQRHTGAFTAVIDTSRKNLGYAIGSNALSSADLHLTGYRRLGTNV